MKSLLFVCGHSFPCYHIDLRPKASSFKINARVSQQTCMLKVPRPYNVLCEEQTKINVDFTKISHLWRNHSVCSQLIRFTKGVWMIRWWIELTDLVTVKLSVNMTANFSLFLTKNTWRLDTSGMDHFYGILWSFVFLFLSLKPPFWFVQIPHREGAASSADEALDQFMDGLELTNQAINNTAATLHYGDEEKVKKHAVSAVSANFGCVPVNTFNKKQMRKRRFMVSRFFWDYTSQVTDCVHFLLIFTARLFLSGERGEKVTTWQWHLSH